MVALGAPSAVVARGVLVAVGALAFWAGCSGVSPDPAGLAAREFPAVELSEGERLEALRLQTAALAAIDRRDWSEAARIAGSALSLDPRLPRARAALGLATFEQGMLVEPSDLFLVHRGDGETASALRLAPSDPVVALLRGRLLASSGHLSAAAAVAENALPSQTIRDDPERIALLEAAATWRYELGEELAALPHLRALTTVQGDRAITHFRLGCSLLRTAQVAATAGEAAAAFERSAALAPGDEDARLAVVAAYVRAAELARKGERAPDGTDWLARAGAAADAAVRAFPQLAEARFRRGIVAELRGDPAAAAASYRETLERQPAHSGALLNLAALLANGADPADRAAARDLWRRALASPEVLTAGERARIERQLRADDPPQ